MVLTRGKREPFERGDDQQQQRQDPKGMLAMLVTSPFSSGSTVVMKNSSMTTEASNASGGQVTITAPEMVQLINSKSARPWRGAVPDTVGGNITIDPQFVILQNSQIIAQANAGAGGAIDIIAGVFIADPNSIVDASSKLGISGTVNIQSPLQNIGGELTPLSQQFSSAAALLAQQCAARVADGKFSTFVVAGREGLPVEPGGFLASPSWTAELLGSSLSGRYPHDHRSQLSRARSRSTMPGPSNWRSMGTHATQMTGPMLNLVHLFNVRNSSMLLTPVRQPRTKSHASDPWVLSMSLRAGLVAATLVLLVVWILSDVVWAQVPLRLRRSCLLPLRCPRNSRNPSRPCPVSCPPLPFRNGAGPSPR